MFRSFIRRIFLTGLTADESPTLPQLLVGFCLRCFWFLIISLFVASVCWCLAGTKWTVEKRNRLWTEFRCETPSILLGASADISRLPPSQQSLFWKQKTSDSANANFNAEELMAAAIVLSEPAFGYASQWTAAQLLHNGNVFDVMEEAAVEYRSQLNGRSSEFAAKAVRDDPGNPELSRIQAMLLFPYSYGSTKTNHCENPNWLNILKSARYLL